MLHYTISTMATIATIVSLVVISPAAAQVTYEGALSTGRAFMVDVDDPDPSGSYSVLMPDGMRADYWSAAPTNWFFRRNRSLYKCRLPRSTPLDPGIRGQDRSHYWGANRCCSRRSIWGVSRRGDG